MRKKKIPKHSNVGNSVFTLKEITIYIVAFFTITFLTAIVYTQNQQIQELLKNIESLQTQIHSLNHDFTVLINEKNAEILALREPIIPAGQGLEQYGIDLEPARKIIKAISTEVGRITATIEIFFFEGISQGYIDEARTAGVEEIARQFDDKNKE